MKKIVLLVGLYISSLFANTTVGYVDLYGEIQVNMVVANKCLEEVAYTRSLNGQQCAAYSQAVNTDVYKRLLNRSFSDLNSQNTHWTKEDWVILKNDMKKLIYVSDLIKQFKN
ncbi:hypothetical protein [Sulfurimonas sp.]|uniref:hypothetical protein n=1 Tax=Sulfurimonas sp. TaxID=2022749 RepID=UPI003568F863